jgi:ferredoxin-thioredoxin reductase catalytic subunit
MKIYRNPNKTIADKVYQSMIQKGGYCPCRLEQSEDNLCICKEFREQIADENFEGFCHCHLYYKEK